MRRTKLWRSNRGEMKIMFIGIEKNRFILEKTVSEVFVFEVDFTKTDLEAEKQLERHAWHANGACQ